MRVVVALEHHFEQTPDGTVWTQTAYDTRFWARYLSVFDRVQVVARVQPTTTKLPDRLRADGERVSFVGVPNYTGPLQYVLQSREIHRKARAAFQMGDAVILRVPSNIGNALLPALQGRQYPYGLQVVGDPHAVFAPGVVNHPLRIVWQQWFTRQLKRQCANAVGAAYVTGAYLQQRYPCRGFMTSFSDVELGLDAFVDVPREPRRLVGPIRLVMVGSLAQLYKAPDILIQAVGLCRGQGMEIELVIIGEGKYRSRLEAQVQASGLTQQVHFLGQLPPGAAVRAELDRADVFVLPSRTEGLPRAMLEAMARALPCIGSTVGGIPELLPPEDMVPPGNAQALADKLNELVTDAPRRARMSARNLFRANEFQQEKLHAKQRAFFGHIRQATEKWLVEHP